MRPEEGGDFLTISGPFLVRKNFLHGSVWCDELNGAKVLDLKLVFTAPGNECGFGDVEFGSDFSKRPALGAELDKALNCLFVVHNGVFRGACAGNTSEVRRCDLSVLFILPHLL